MRKSYMVYKTNVFKYFNKLLNTREISILVSIKRNKEKIILRNNNDKKDLGSLTDRAKAKNTASLSIQH